MALFDPRPLETLRTAIQPPIDTNLRDLDSEMTNILDKTGIDASEKVRLYNQALLRYNDMAKMSATNPTPVVMVKENETPPDNGYYGRGRDDTSQSATREGASVGVAFNDNTVERQRRVVTRRDDRTRQRNFFLSMLRAWAVFNCLIWGFGLWVRVEVLGSDCNNRFPNTNHNLNHDSNEYLTLTPKSNPELTLTLTLY